jgi:hypothetical protein
MALMTTEGVLFLCPEAVGVRAWIAISRTPGTLGDASGSTSTVAR